MPNKTPITHDLIQNNRSLAVILEVERARAPYADTLEWIAMYLGIARGPCRYHLRKIGVTAERVAQLAQDPLPKDDDKPAHEAAHPTREAEHHADASHR